MHIAYHGTETFHVDDIVNGQQRVLVFEPCGQNMLCDALVGEFCKQFLELYHHLVESRMVVSPGAPIGYL